ncbi:MAG: hypothetical protein EA385_01135 [Salinarimonadaceae bacterium]|nr:MAG: hypothetical protein EA385_01135 [Salinarimonadaceae bacterium]
MDIGKLAGLTRAGDVPYVSPLEGFEAADAQAAIDAILLAISNPEVAALRTVGDAAGNLAALGGGGRFDPARLGSGDPSAGTYLRGDGVWAGPPPGDVRLISEYPITEAVSYLDITEGIDATYDEYELTFHGVVPASNDAGLLLRISTDGGDNFQASSYLSAAQVASSGGTNTWSASTIAHVLAPAFTNAGASNSAANGGVAGSVSFRPNGTSARKLINGEAGYRSAGLGLISARSAGMWDGGNAAINAVRIIPSSGGLAAGVFRLWARKKNA